MARVPIFGFILVVLLTSCREKQPPPFAAMNQEIQKQLQGLLDQHDYFRLRNLLVKYHASIAPAQLLFYSANIQNAFNQNLKSSQTIRQLLETSPSLHDSVAAKLLLVQRDNFIKLFDYKNAAKTGRQVVDHYQTYFTNEEIKDIKNKNLIYEGLRDTPPQTTSKQGNSTIPWKKDQVGLVNIPVGFGKNTYDFIFDTRAGISVMAKSYANKLKLRMPGVRYQEGSGTTGKTFEAELGIADSLTIGNITVHHVVFQVLPDEILSFPSMNYSMKAIIGLPVILQWQQFQISKKGVLDVPSKPDTSTLQNIALNESAIVLLTVNEKDTLNFYLDTGANQSELFYNFYTKRKDFIKQVAKSDSIEVGGVGGIKKRLVFILPSITLAIGAQTATLNDIQVLTKSTYTGQKYDGNMGQDVITQFSSMTINFESMSLSFH